MKCPESIGSSTISVPSLRARLSGSRQTAAQSLIYENRREMMVERDGMEEQQIAEFRKQIDALDDEIARHLSERAKIVLAIRELKNRANLPLFDAQREQEILTRMSLMNSGPLSDEDLKEIYRNVLHYMRNFE